MAKKKEYRDIPTFLGRTQYSESDMHRIIYNLLTEGKLDIPSLKGGMYFSEYHGADIFKLGIKPPRTVEGTIIEIKYNDNKAEYVIKQIKNREYAFKNILLPEIKKKTETAGAKPEDLEFKINSVLMHNNPSNKLVGMCKENGIEVIKYSEPTMKFEKIY